MKKLEKGDYLIISEVSRKYIDDGSWKFPPEVSIIVVAVSAVLIVLVFAWTITPPF